MCSSYNLTGSPAHTLAPYGQGKSWDMTRREDVINCHVGLDPPSSRSRFSGILQQHCGGETRSTQWQWAEPTKFCAKRMALGNVLDKERMVTGRLDLVTNMPIFPLKKYELVVPRGIPPDHFLLEKPVSHCDEQHWEASTMSNSEYLL